MQKAVTIAAATDNKLHELLRYDVNIVNGITSVIKEHKITESTANKGKSLYRIFIGPYEGYSEQPHPKG